MKKSFCTTILCLFTIALFAQNLWSDPATWGGSKPTAGQDVVIPNGTTIILDENPPALGGLTIMGTLEFERQDRQLSAEWIMVHGTLRVGSEAQPFAQRATITLTDTDLNESIMGMGTRGIMVMGGALELHGTPPSVIWTKINAHAAAGATNLTLMESVNWQVNDQIAIAPTDYFQAGYGASIAQRLSLAAVNGSNLSLNAGLNAFRWGLLQYATPTGMSLSSANLVAPPLADNGAQTTPRILDERAAVGNLSRNIVIEAPNDAAWTTHGFGVHVMVMRDGGNVGVAHISGVEFRRGGQRGRLGRYPFHWHMLSYNGTATLADATGQYIRNSTVNSSENRGIVIHGTNGVTVQNNVVFDVRGHGIFLEDAVERRNMIDGNLVMHVRNPTGNVLKQHESDNNTGGSAGFWISNPDNTLTNNLAADCFSHGFWLAFPTRPFGESANVLHTDGVLLNPSRLLFGVFDNNTAQSNRRRGIMLDDVEIDDVGNFFPFQYQSTTNGRNPTWNGGTLRRFALSRYKVWKNGESGVWDRGVWADNYEAVSADNCGRFFAGSGSDGVIERSLIVGTSLNTLMNGTGRPALADVVGGNETPAAFATYHSSFDIRHNIVVNFPAVANQRSGAFATEDYYIRPVEKGQVRNVNNLLIQSHPGVKLPAPFNYFALAGALHDPNANWGVNGSNSYFVYDSPFFTYGQTPVAVSGGSDAGGVLVQGPFYGFNDFILNSSNDPQEDLMAIRVRRQDAAQNQVGIWEVQEAGATSWLLAHMRHFAAQRGGFYELDFPNIATVTDVAMSVENMLTANDTLVLAVEYSGTYDISQVYTSSFPNFMSDGHANWPTSYANKHVYTPVASRQAVIESVGGRAYWHDKANHRVWIKLQGGIQQLWNDADYSATSDERLYRLFNLRVYGQPAVLPIDLQSFTAQPHQNSVLLNWKIAQNTEGGVFEVEKSLDGKIWRNLTHQKIENALLEYAFTDKSPVLGIQFYRLKMVDFKGKIQYSKTLSVAFDTEGGQKIQIAPNPASDFLTVALSHLDKDKLVSWSIMDVFGKVYLSQSGVFDADFKINIGTLSKGFFVLKIENQGRVWLEKFIKQ